MQPARSRRSAGRPPRGKGVVSRERILDAALVLLEAGGLAAVTMRGLARRMHVDPMAPYHYFPNKDAMLKAAAARRYAELAFRPRTNAPWQRELKRLAVAYLRLLEGAGELLDYVTDRPSAAKAPAKAFDALFRQAIAELGLAGRDVRTASHVFVDFLHGFSLASRGRGKERTRERLPARRGLVRELRVLFAGIEALGASGRR